MEPVSRAGQVSEVSKRLVEHDCRDATTVAVPATGIFTAERPDFRANIRDVVFVVVEGECGLVVAQQDIRW